MTRVYLDWNATAPLRPEARAAMHDAMECLGNPSSVHAEGRAARAIVERARVEVADAFGAEPSEVTFTSGATEAAALAMSSRRIACAEIEHDCILAWADSSVLADSDGRVEILAPRDSALQAASGETGVLQRLPKGLAVSDFAQAFGKIACDFASSGIDQAIISAHKIGGPKGAGALVVRDGLDLTPRIRGGGQESGRRAGTENVIGIAGFGAAAAAAARDVRNGLWDELARLRDDLEARLETEAPGTVFFGRNSCRLPNTSCFAYPGWSGETQTMQMDLRGFSISSGSACSSGKVAGSRALRSMGHDPATVASAVRVSAGPATLEADMIAFAEEWIAAGRRYRARAA